MSLQGLNDSNFVSLTNTTCTNNTTIDLRNATALNEDLINKLGLALASGVTLLEGARGQGTAGCPIDGFHVTSYQTNCAGHHTRDRHVGFFSAQRSACTQCKKIEVRNARKPCGAWGVGV